MQDAIRVKGNKQDGGCGDEFWSSHQRWHDRGGSQGNRHGYRARAVITTITLGDGLGGCLGHFAVTVCLAHRRGGRLSLHGAMIRTGERQRYRGLERKKHYQ